MSADQRAVIRAATCAGDRAIARALIREYAEGLDVDLAYQGIDEELGGLRERYAAPNGCLLLAEVDREPAGCVAVRRLGDDLCELKRLFVRPAHRGFGLGRLLTLAAVEEARRLGYARMRLDSLPSMATAAELYRSLGFREIAPYYASPVEGTLFLELDLEHSC